MYQEKPLQEEELRNLLQELGDISSDFSQYIHYLSHRQQLLRKMFAEEHPASRN